MYCIYHTHILLFYISSLSLPPSLPPSLSLPPSPSLPLPTGYDDDNGSYIKVLHDHIAYRYEIREVIGKGSFGQVVKCYDHKTKQPMAIKIIRNKKRFHHQALVEVKILDSLRKKVQGAIALLAHTHLLTQTHTHTCSHRHTHTLAHTDTHTHLLTQTHTHTCSYCIRSGAIAHTTLAHTHTHQSSKLL